MLNVGSVQAFASLNDRGFKSGLRRMRMEGNKTGTHIERRFDRVGSKLSMIGVAAAASMGTAFAALATKAVKVASDAGEIEQKFDVVFSGIQKKADETATSLERSFGLSSQSAQKLLGDVGDILTGFGFTQESALNLSKQVNELAVDLASFTNFAGGAEGASRALTKALLGEAESVKALGIVIRQDTDEYKDLVDSIMQAQGVSLVQAKALAALRIATEQSKNAIGDFARTQDSLANQSRVAQERTLTLLRSFGNLVIKVGSLNDVIRDLNTGLLRTTESLDNAGTAADGAANYFRGFYEILKGGLSIITGTSQKFSKFSDTIRTIFDYHPAFMIPRYIMSIGEEARDASKEADRLAKAADIEINYDEQLQELTKLGEGFKGIFDDVSISDGGFSPDDLIVSSGKVEQTTSSVGDLNRKLSEQIQFLQTLDGIKYFVSSQKAAEGLAQAVNSLKLPKPEGTIFDPTFAGASIEPMRNLNDLVIALDSHVPEKLPKTFNEMPEKIDAAAASARMFSTTFADGLNSVLFQARSVQDAIQGIIKQLASRALTAGLMSLFSGGSLTFANAFLGTTRHAGGVVPGVGERQVNLMGGEMVLTKSQQKALASGGGGSREIALTINLKGSSQISGNTIRQVYDEAVRQTVRLQ